MESATAPLVGGRYQLEHPIADGGMGRVWSARDVRLGRRVAVKFLRRDLLADGSVLARFRGEARAAARLAHRNVVQVYDSGADDAVPYLVMELLPGRTLAHEVGRDGPLPEDRVRAVGRDVLAALAAAHAAGIVHRDVKPGNVLLADDGTAKVADFGIAKTADAAATQSGEIVGTVAYMAPERLAGEPATPRSDLYSVGAVLFEALTGRAPFDVDDPWAAADAIRRGDRPSVRDLRPDVDPALAEVVEGAMALDPDRRFSSAAQMAAALGSRAPAGPVAPTAGAGTAPTAVPPPSEGPQPRRRRSRLLSALTVLVAVVAVVLVVGALLRDAAPGGRPDRPAERTSNLPPALEDSLERLEEAVRP
ncbi:MAG TPA: serine/threonine-protein kinase [Actinomycetota bacterium]|nr:serine/threonine-protein kinase [Actinomycetota bacterium]